MKRTGARERKRAVIVALMVRSGMARTGATVMLDSVEAEARDREALRIAARLIHEGANSACYIGEDIRAEVAKRRKRRKP